MARYIMGSLLFLWGSVVVGAALFDWETGQAETGKRVTGLLMGVTVIGWGIRCVWWGDPAKPNSGAQKYQRRDELTNWSFPGWSGPFVSVAVVFLLTLRMTLSDGGLTHQGDLTFLEQILIITGFGLICGFAMWAIDAIRDRAGGSQ